MRSVLLLLALSMPVAAQKIPDDSIDVQFAAISIAQRICKQIPDTVIYLPKVPSNSTALVLGKGARWTPVPCSVLKGLVDSTKIRDFFDLKAAEQSELNAKFDEVLRTLRKVGK